MDTPTLKKLLTRARQNLDAAIGSIDAGRLEQADVTIRGAYDILGYVETKRALAAPDSCSSTRLPQHD